MRLLADTRENRREHCGSDNGRGDAHIRLPRNPQALVALALRLQLEVLPQMLLETRL
jgi:hypothetical protein